MKDKWIQNLLKGKGEILALKNKRGVLFSTITLEQIIDEEIRHEKYILHEEDKRSIRTFSSGEQRKALLNYLIDQKPDFLLLDNPFDCLDIVSVEALRVRLAKVSKQICIVQIIKRQDDILPFVSEVILIKSKRDIGIYSLQEFNQKHLHKTQRVLKNNIPSTFNPFSNILDVLVEMKDVCVTYENRKIINNINWRIRKGEFWHLKGVNGSGKTTLLSMIYGDNPKAYGQQLFLFGHKKGSGESVWQIKEKIGYFTPSLTELFQGNHTVEQMLISGLVDSVGLYLKPTDKQKNLAQEWLNVLNLQDSKDDRFYSLSQVNQRLVLIARAMIKHPPLLILDEPSTGLDDASASLMVELIQKIAEESTTAVIYVSHRSEKGLKPQFIYELQLKEGGSIGRVL